MPMADRICLIVYGEKRKQSRNLIVCCDSTACPADLTIFKNIHAKFRKTNKFYSCLIRADGSSPKNLVTHCESDWEYFFTMSFPPTSRWLLTKSGLPWWHPWLLDIRSLAVHWLRAWGPKTFWSGYHWIDWVLKYQSNKLNRLIGSEKG